MAHITPPHEYIGNDLGLHYKALLATESELFLDSSARIASLGNRLFVEVSHVVGGSVIEPVTLQCISLT
jgi:hypothetical protein